MKERNLLTDFLKVYKYLKKKKRVSIRKKKQNKQETAQCRQAHGPLYSDMWPASSGSVTWLSISAWRAFDFGFQGNDSPNGGVQCCVIIISDFLTHLQTSNYHGSLHRIRKMFPMMTAEYAAVYLPLWEGMDCKCVCWFVFFTYKTKPKSQAKRAFTVSFMVLKGSRHLFQLVPGQRV